MASRSRKEESTQLRCSVCGKTFISEIANGEHIKNHEWSEKKPSPVPAVERYHEGNPGITAGVAQHEAGGQFSGQPTPWRAPYKHRHKPRSKSAQTKNPNRKRR